MLRRIIQYFIGIFKKPIAISERPTPCNYGESLYFEGRIIKHGNEIKRTR